MARAYHTKATAMPLFVIESTESQILPGWSIYPWSKEATYVNRQGNQSPFNGAQKGCLEMLCSFDGVGPLITCTYRLSSSRTSWSSQQASDELRGWTALRIARDSGVGSPVP